MEYDMAALASILLTLNQAALTFIAVKNQQYDVLFIGVLTEHRLWSPLI